jgi:hypothetical protein
MWSLTKHGVTQGLLADWLVCRSKARIKHHEMFRPARLGLGLVYGNLVHSMLEQYYQALAAGKHPTSAFQPDWLRKAEADWQLEHPRANATARADAEMAAMFVEAVLPCYAPFWQDQKRTWLRAEHTFNLPLALTELQATVFIRVRGKIDAIFQQPKKQLWLLETKTSSILNDEGELATLPGMLQSNVYLWAISKLFDATPKGCLKNMIRRPGLEQKKQSAKEFKKRIIDDVQRRPEFYFARVEATFGSVDLKLFEKELRAMVTELYLWDRGTFAHYRSGQCLQRWGVCDCAQPCLFGDYSGMVRQSVVFPELQERR